MVKQINVGEALEQFKNEVVPLMSLAELEALHTSSQAVKGLVDAMAGFE